MQPEDTIAAVSTAQGFAMRSIIRLSGSHAVRAGCSFFEADPGYSPEEGFSASPGRLNLPAEKLRAPAVLYTMRAPHSYTREDVTELHVPGSPALVDMILDELLECFPRQLRLAKPGEFTQRAFLNGRIDMAQAEAVLSVITAKNRSELLAASARLEGSTSVLIDRAREELVELRAAIEAALDFDAQGIEIITEREFLKTCCKLCEKLSAELEKGRGELAGKGQLSVALCGPPNAGKSSILNRLIGAESAIVHHSAGTTRDPVKESVEIAGISFIITDTAGIEELKTPSLNEQNGMDFDSGKPSDIDSLAARYAGETTGKAQLVILVFDAAQPIPEKWKNAHEHIDEDQTLCVFNKCDLPREANPDLFSKGVKDLLYVSALKQEGIDELKDAIARVVLEGGLDASAADCLFNARQREAVREAISHLKDAEEAVKSGLGFEFSAMCLRDASDALGEVTGDTENMEVLDRVFNRFCIGK